MGRSVLTNGDDQRVSYNVKPLQQQIGDLTKLGTTDKTSLVNALNEVKSEKEDSSLIGDLTELNTSDKSNLVAAINSNASELAAIATVYASNFYNSSIDWGTAINNAIASLNGSGLVVLPSGTLTITTPIMIKTGIILRGQGLKTILSPVGCPAISCAKNQYLQNFSIEDINISGDNGGIITAYDATRHGISLDSGSDDTYQGNLKNVQIVNCAGKGLYMPNAFSMNLERVYVNNCGGNGIEVSGGPSTTLNNCYVHNVATGKCGYRIYSSATLISCNGVDSGDVWGVFGADSTTTYNDGTTISPRQYNVILINCNIEAFLKKGLLFQYQGRFAIHNCVFLVYSNVTTFEYYIDAEMTSGCFIDATTTFQTSSTSIHPANFCFRDNFNVLSFNPSITKFVGSDQTTITTMPQFSYENTFGNEWLDLTNVNIKSMNYYYHGGNRNSAGTVAPTSGTWNVGDRYWNTTPSAGGNIGWVCVASGTPGTWKTFGTIGS